MDKKTIDKVYYETGEILITDSQYDELYNPQEEVNEDVYSENKVKHWYPQTSVAKTYNIEDLLEFISSFKEVLVQPKLDGMTAIVYYENYTLKHFLTRGNGIYGESIIEYSKFLPQKINFERAIIKGELVISIKNYLQFKEEYSLPRSFVVGNIKSKYNNPELLKYIDFLVFEAYFDENRSLLDNLLIAKSLNFKIAPTYIQKEISENMLSNYYSSFISEYPSDGIILRENDIIEAKKKGLFTEEPKYIIAFKFKSLSKETEVIDVKWNITKSGKYSPIAILKPIELNGSLVEKVTLFNYEFVKLNRVGKGSKVTVSKHGEIIPYIDKIISPSDTLVFPNRCRYCNSKLVQEGVHLFCKNPNCIGRNYVKYFNFLRALGIKHLGIKTFEKYSKYINSYLDALYIDKHFEDTKFLNKIKKELESIRNNLTLETFLVALGIDNCSTKTIKVILSIAKSKEHLIEILQDTNKLITIPNVGPITASNIVEFFNRNAYILDFIKSYSFKEPSKKSNKLAGLNISITGKFSIPRKEIIKLIEENGGKVLNLSKNTNILLVGENPTSRKVDFAKTNGIQIVTDLNTILN